MPAERPIRFDSQGHAVRILIVEDDVDSNECLTLLLSAEGFDVRGALNAQQALALVATFPPHVAVVDIGLPTMSGIELLALLKAMPHLSKCKYVATTGYALDRRPERSFAGGFDRILMKPVDLQSVLTAVESLLERVD